MNTEWKSVDRELPEKGKRVLCFGGEIGLEVGALCCGEEIVFKDSDFVPFWPSYWAEIDNLPVKAKTIDVDEFFRELPERRKRKQVLDKP